MKELNPKQIEEFALKTYGATLEALDRARDTATAVALLHPAILKLLAEGQPVATDKLAEAAEHSVQEVENMLLLLPNLEFDNRGRILGFGLSFLPTVHRVYLHNHDRWLYAWCVPDALVLPRLISEYATILSPCQATGNTIRVEIDPDAVKKVQPADAVVSWWIPGINAQDLRGTSCVNQNLFISEEASTAWQKNHSGSTILSVADTFRVLDVIRERQYA